MATAGPPTSQPRVPRRVDEGGRLKHPPHKSIAGAHTPSGSIEHPATRGRAMVEAYVLVNAEAGLLGRAVSRETAAIKGVLSADDLSGPYDVIARSEARDLDELARLVVAKIQVLKGVTRTITCPVVHLQ